MCGAKEPRIGVEAGTMAQTEGPEPVQAHLREAAANLRREADALELLADTLPAKLPGEAAVVFRKMIWNYRATV